ncbi:hypothetical protein BU15DRAFT_81506 [Melanogaster broomeanus]|nr:hypothetical protein BU15DRAFT_81506 [Melanogaster broomeanus]
MSLTIRSNTLLDLNYGTDLINVRYMNSAITFDEEVAFIKKSRWNTVKVLYLVCRYLPFLLVATNTSRFLQPGLSQKACESYFQFNSFASAIVIICAELMFLVRTYALWDRTRPALAIILVNFLALFIPITVIVVLCNSAPTIVPVPGITSCATASQSHVMVWAYVLLVIGETGSYKKLSLNMLW